MKVKLHTTEGSIVIELDEEKAPGTSANFLSYVRSGHYDGTIFHRVIQGFMIQGGGFEAGMRQKQSGKSIKNEADNGLSNTAGTIAMARTSEPHSASCQFFINAADNKFLDHSAPTADGWGYCVFGRVTQGMDVVSRIEKVSTGTQSGHQDVPVQDIVLERAEAIEIK